MNNKTSNIDSEYKVKLIKEEIPKVFEELKLRNDIEGKKLPGISTGYYELDKLTQGFKHSELIIIAGSPSHGKTLLSLNIARRAALNGYKIAFFSLEMIKTEIITKLISLESRVDGQKLKLGKTSSEEWLRVEKAIDKLNYNLYLDDTFGMNLQELSDKIRKLKLENEIDMVIIDYIQLLKADEYYNKQDIETEKILRNLKVLAKELNIPIVAISKLKYGIDYRKKEKRPELSDLSYSGTIEHIADVIIFVYRDYLVARPNKFNPRYEEIRRNVDITIAKQRNGPEGKFQLVFIEEYTRFEDKTRLPELICTKDSPFF